jgi:hypothetical protein
MEINQQIIAKSIELEMKWLEEVINIALTLHFKNECSYTSVYEINPPHFEKNEAYYHVFDAIEFSFNERLVLIMALAPHVKPQSLDLLLVKNQSLNCEFSEFGGYKDTTKSGFQPTIETACFLLSGGDLNNRFHFIKTFDKNHILYKRGILDFDSEQEFGLNQRLIISNEFLGLFTTGHKNLPEYSSKFPAKQIHTTMNWKDLIIDEKVMLDLTEIKDWLLYSEVILNKWNLSKNLKQGYRVLFYGPPGTGKTLAATLLGKETERPVYRVDLSLVVSKYIGETEKNLGKLFDEAEHKDWILFFDEADALFGKRTQTKGANDRYANQEVAYLLQRIEDFAGLVILATNIQTNIDEAFSRRFQSMIHFPKPSKNQRKQLWQKLFFDSFSMDETLSANELSEKYELSGGEMINVLRYCALEAAKRNQKHITSTDVLQGIRREYNKQNKTL